MELSQQSNYPNNEIIRLKSLHFILSHHTFNFLIVINLINLQLTPKNFTIY